MVRGNALEMSHQSQMFLRGLPPRVEVEVSRRLESRYPLFRSGLLWPIEVVVRITKEVIEDGVSCSSPCLASKKSSSALEPPSRHSSLPSISYQSSAPVKECSRSCSRRHSQGSSSSKPTSCSPFEASPRTSKYPLPNPEFASSSSSPLRVTSAGSWHPVVRPHRCDHGWQAGDSPSNPLRSSRDNQDSCG
ncbi:hypothetical protein PISMIDRAFT_232202 [Pisolithus microcarpus 441]|uniref:Uncharacterized protein n=1 Tax=Pisolithus microcarpus 441 TaxID=765257 RepID=A0A0C9Z480_9AGAM|nr:hypothetical protein PISMIDRAFT_232202 [Pisolithus microcarpus 441]